MPLCFSRISYLSFDSEITKRKRHSLQPCKFLTDNNARWTIDEFIGFLPGEEYIIEVTMQIKITGENVKFIGNRSFQESFVNMSLHT